MRTYKKIGSLFIDETEPGTLVTINDEDYETLGLKYETDYTLVWFEQVRYYLVMNYTDLIFNNMRLQVNLETKHVRAMLDDGQVLNAIQWANVSESMFKDRFNKEKCTDYELFTTFFFDLSIAEYYGKDAIEETYDRVVKSWLSNYKYFAEFVLCLNWKIWSWYGLGYKDVGLIYDKLWKKADALIWERYGEDEEASSYIFHVLD